MTNNIPQTEQIENEIRQLTERIIKQKLNPFDAYIGHILKTKRKELKLSQTQVAYLLGVTFQQVQKYEKGINKISSDKLLDLTYLIKIPFQSLISGYEVFANHLKNISNLTNKSTDLSVNERKLTPLKTKKDVQLTIEKIKNLKTLDEKEMPYEISNIFEKLTPKDFQNFYQSSVNEAKKTTLKKNMPLKKMSEQEINQQMFNLYEHAYQRIEINPFGKILKEELDE